MNWLSPRFWRIACLLFGVGGLWYASTAVPQEPTPSSSQTATERQQELEELGWRVQVLDQGQNPESTPPVTAQPISLDELRRLLPPNSKGPSETESFAVATSAVFRATLEEGELRHGELQIDVLKQGPAVAWLDWTSTNLAIQNLQIETHGASSSEETPQIRSRAVPAVWGGTPEDRSVVRVEEGSSVLTGRWSAASREQLPCPRFALSFPPALHTRLQIRTPHDRRLTASAGLLGVPISEGTGWLLWELDLGRRKEVELIVEPAAALEEGPQPMARAETAYSARQDGLYMQVDLQLEVLGSALPYLEVEIPEILDFSSAALNGIPAPIDRGPSRPGTAIVRLGEVPVGPVSVLRLQFYLPIRWGKTFDLPQVRFPQVQLLDERLTLFVEAPLLVRSLVPRNLLQIGLSPDLLGELWTFQSQGMARSLAVDIGLPAQSLNVAVDTAFSCDPQFPTALCQLHLSSRSGQVSRLDLDLPTGWYVTAVEEDNSPAEVIWGVRDVGNQRLLGVELSQVISPEQPGTLWVTLRQGALPADQPFPLPLLRPRTGGEVSGKLIWRVPPDRHLEFLGEARTAWHEFLSTELQPLAEALTTLAQTKDTLELDPHGWQWRLPETGLPETARLVVATSLVPQSELIEETPSPTLPIEPQQEIPQPALAHLELTTVLAPRGGAAHLQRAVYKFTEFVQLSALSIRLPEQCSISAVVASGESLTILRQGPGITFPQTSAKVRELEMTYVVPTTGGWLFRDVELPVPVGIERVNRFVWKIESGTSSVPVVLNLSDSLRTIPSSDEWSTRWLGPLARSSGEPWFHPLRSESWLFLADSPPVKNQTEMDFSVTLVGVSLPPTLLLRIWEREPVRSASWVVLFACGVVGTLIRRGNWNWLRQLAIPWLLILLGFSVALPALPAQIAGGAFLGTVLSLLIPRRIIQSPDLFSPATQPDRQPSPLVTVAGCLLLGVMLFIGAGDFPSVARAQEVEPRDVWLVVTPTGEVTAFLAKRPVAQQESKLPPYLLTAADYTLLPTEMATPIARVKGLFQVRVLDRGTTSMVRLPLGQIVLPNGAQCLIDGKETSLIPSATGDALLCPLPEGAQESTHEIEIEFGIKPNEEGRFLATIPPQVNAMLTVPQSLPYAIEHWGMSRAGTDELRLVSLGRLTQLNWRQTATEVQKSASMSAQSLLFVTPLRISATTLLQIPVQNSPLSPFTLELPHGALLRRVSSEQAVSWREEPSQHNQRLFTFENPSKEACAIRLEYEWAQQPVNSGAVLIPELIRCGLPVSSHDIALILPPGLRIAQITDGGGNSLQPLAPEERTGPLLGDPRVQDAVHLSGPESIHLNVNRTADPVRATVSEKWIVRRGNVRLEARIHITPSAVPQYLQPVALAGNWQIDSVQLEQKEARRSVRWQPTTTGLLAFLPDITNEPHTLLISAELPLPADTWLLKPEVTPTEATVSQREITIEDHTDWQIEVETTGGTLLSTPIGRPSTDSTVSGTVKSLQFPATAPVQPQRMRLLPASSAAQAQIVSSLGRNRSGKVIETRRYQVQGIDAPLNRIVLKLPKSTADRLLNQPAGLTMEITEETEQTAKLTLLVPARWRNSVTFELAWELETAANAIPQLPQIELASATTTASFLIIPRALEIVVERGGGRLIPLSGIPSTARTAWIESVRNKLADPYQLTGPSPQLVSRPAASREALIPWLEHTLWIHPDRTLHGQTRFWLLGQEQARLTVQLAPETQLQGAIACSGSVRRVPESNDVLLVTGEDGIAEISLQWNGGPVTEQLTLPTFADVASERALVRVISSEGSTAELSDETPGLTRWEAELARLDGYLDCLESAPATVAIDGSLMRQLRHTLGTVDSFVQTAPADQQPELNQQRTIRRTRWDRLQQELPLAAGSPVELQHDDILGDLQGEWSGLTQTYVTSAPLISLKLQHEVPSAELPRQATTWGVVCVLGLLTMWFLKVVPVREWLADHPAWAGLLLGLLWWTCLAPSVFGFALVAVSSLGILARLVLQPKNVAVPSPTAR